MAQYTGRTVAETVILDGVQGVSTGGAAYVTVAASTTQLCGATGAVNDFLSGLFFIPTTTSPQSVSIKDGATSIQVFNGGASSLVHLAPFFVDLNILAKNAGWSVVTGTGMTVIATGRFT